MLHTKEIRQSYGHIKHTPRAAIAGVCAKGGGGVVFVLGWLIVGLG